jgi:hypothetical protein
MKRTLFACLVAAVACGADTTGPENSEARWELREINGVSTIVGMPGGDTIPQIRLFCTLGSSAPTYTLQVMVRPKWTFGSSGEPTINLETSPDHGFFGPTCNWVVNSGNASCTTDASGVRAFATEMANATSVELSFFIPDGDSGTIIAREYPTLTLLPLLSGAFSECDDAEP